MSDRRVNPQTRIGARGSASGTGTEMRAITLIGALSLIGFLGFAAAGWPGAPNQCLVRGDCYCEAARPGPIAQPANTWSLLGFVVAAAGVAAYSGRSRARRASLRNAMGLSFYPATYASTVLLLATGGAFFHASLTDWGGVVDVLSMFLWIGFLIAYNLTSIYPFPRRSFAILLVAASGLLVVPRLFSGEAGIAVFRLVVWLWIGSELIVWLASRGAPSGAFRALERNRRWLAASVGVNLVALQIWELGHAGTSYCNPDSLLQPHAAWHVLNALAAALLYPYLLSECPAPRAAQRGAAAAGQQRVSTDVW